jgi:hypothetical protein
MGQLVRGDWREKDIGMKVDIRFSGNGQIDGPAS